MYYTFAFKNDKHCPAFIDGVIHDSFYPGAYDDGMQSDWHYGDPDQPLARLPEKLVLVTKDKPYELDFRSAFQGYVVSERFLKAFKTMRTGNWEVSELEIVTPKGLKVSQHKYFFMRQQNADKNPEDVIDKENSKIEFRKNGDIKHIASLIMRDVLDLDCFSINDFALFGCIFLSAQAANIFTSMDLKGLEIVGTEQLGIINRA